MPNSPALRCIIFGCSSTSKTEPKPNFYRIPHPKFWNQKRLRWIKAIQDGNGAQWYPQEWHRVCSKHFRSGTHSQSVWDEDYVPTQNMIQVPTK